MLDEGILPSEDHTVKPEIAQHSPAARGPIDRRHFGAIPMKVHKFDFDSLLVRRIGKGDRRAVRQFLESFCNAVENGRTPSRTALAYIASAFRQMLAGTKAEAALGLAHGRQGRPSRPRPTFPENDKQRLQLACAMDVVSYLESGHKLSIAYELVATDRGVPVMTVRRAWRTWQRSAYAFTELEKFQAYCQRLGPAELLRRARLEEVEFFQQSGADAAAEYRDMTPAAAWTECMGDEKFADEMKSRTEPIDDQGTIVVAEAELKAAFIRGFRNARARERRAAVRREGAAPPRKPQRRRR